MTLRRFSTSLLLLAMIALAGNSVHAGALALSGHPGPAAFDSDGNLWLAESGTHGVAEVNPATRAVVRVVSGPQYEFDDPTAITVANGDVWVASVGFTGSRGNASAARLTEFSAMTTRLIRVINLKKRGIQGLSELWASGSTLWLSASSGAAIVAIDTNSGRIVHSYVSKPVLGNSQPSGVVATGGRVMYVDQSYSRIVVRQISSGRVVRTFAPKVFARVPGLAQRTWISLGPQLLAVTPSDIWAVCGASRYPAMSSLIEINRRTGTIARRIDDLGNGLYNPIQVASSSGLLYVLGGPEGTPYGQRGANLTVIREDSGRRSRVIHFLKLDGKFADPSGLAVNDRYVVVADAGVSRVFVFSKALKLLGRVRL